MKLPHLACWLLLALAASLGADPAAAATAANSKTQTLRPFASEREFRAFVATLRRSQPVREAPAPPPAPVAPMPAPMQAASPASAKAESTTLDRIEVTGSRIGPPAAESITNVQTQGVDEGDIVKKQGDYLIVLRRGRLFTVRIGGDALQPVSSIDAFAPNSDPNETWYDEMLVSRDTVVVIGYSYDRGGTEVGVFDLTAQGLLKYRATYQLRSNDYYSASNYASRLIGRTLIFYSPLQLYPGSDLAQSMPALRHWHRGVTPADFKRILPATRIYRSAAPVGYDFLTLHTVASCDLDAQPMRCTSTAVLGPASRSFYVSEDSVYVWTLNWNLKSSGPNAAILRIPLDGAAPTGLRASGSPWDQMSFLQRDGWLNVLVGSQSDGEGMWSSRSTAGELALLRVRLDSFGDGRAVAARKAYRVLPELNALDAAMHARFIGDWLVYGAGENWDDQARPLRAYALRYADTAPVTTLALKHQVERVDALGDDAVLVGGNDVDDHLYFSSVRLHRGARVADTYVQRDARQGDERTHGFFYRAQDEERGILGLPVLSEDNSDREQASVLFLRNQRLTLSALGQLSSKSDPNVDDGCKVSCVDWYGNARPIFIGERVFALLGYELVEGRDDGNRIRERRRTDFSPRVKVSP
ncbi:beta-propeller domain-containing protein [Lysobacter sp. Root690]|uniref:beta-propeller domain-containing protein n=1 Tax=Lysobacter sp. Root690 TaxID=1736588 RepID=UPI0009EB649B|nr:beta-propeller domain-containing protein [Lysobacter sp. Root690]